nr:MAG TPA: hypothetical protein [Caudoviricetes sp.]
MANPFTKEMLFDLSLCPKIENFKCSFIYGKGLVTFNLIRNQKGDREPFSMRIYDRYYKCGCQKEAGYIVSADVIYYHTHKFLPITETTKISSKLLSAIISQERRENANA